MKPEYASEVAKGERFEFGKNWDRFLRLLNEERITAAVKSLQDMLEVPDFADLSFLDIGSGSGLFSLAARTLGATVVSFDFDTASVACTQQLKRRYYPQDPHWRIETGSALDRTYIDSLGQYDIVYSWGVLHHTGDMWRALENASIACKSGGLLYISIYNDQGGTSQRWTALKRLYNKSPRPAKFLLEVAVSAYFISKRGIALAAKLENPFSRDEQERGMSYFRGVVDWVGGYPFEVASPEKIFDFYRARGFTLMKLKTNRGHGCNEFVFRRER